MDEDRHSTEKFTVFISYSREDVKFADQLLYALRHCGFQPLIDHSAPGGVEWQENLRRLIRSANAVAFVLSPSSAVSRWCAWEVDEAISLGKRIVPVLCQPLRGTKPPEKLTTRNYVFFYEERDHPGSGFGQGLVRLDEALRTDIEWLRQHTRLLQRATEWEEGGRPANRLLSGSDIADAKAWAARRPSDEEAPTILHLEFIRDSEAEATRQADAGEQRLRQIAEAQTAREKALADSEAAQALANEALQREAVAQRQVVRRTRIGLVTALTLAALAIALAYLSYLGADRAYAEAERANAEAKRANEAIRQLASTSRVIAKDPKLAPEMAPELASVLERHARSALIAVLMQPRPKNELVLALADAELAVTLLPRNVYALDTRGQIYLALGRLDEAFSDLESALKLDRGRTFSMFGFEAGVEFETNASTLYCRGQIHEKRGRLEAAMSDYREAIVRASNRGIFGHDPYVYLSFVEKMSAERIAVLESSIKRVQGR